LTTNRIEIRERKAQRACRNQPALCRIPDRGLGAQRTDPPRRRDTGLFAVFTYSSPPPSPDQHWERSAYSSVQTLRFTAAVPPPFQISR